MAGVETAGTDEFPDFEELHPPLRLPHRGTVYTLPYVGVKDAETVARALAPDQEAPDDDELQRILLGDALEEMRADNVPPPFIQRVILTALADFQSGRAVARMMWETGARPAAVEEWLGTRLSNAVDGAEPAAPEEPAAEAPAP